MVKYLLSFAFRLFTYIFSFSLRSLRLLVLGAFFPGSGEFVFFVKFVSVFCLDFDSYLSIITVNREEVFSLEEAIDKIC